MLPSQRRRLCGRPGPTKTVRVYRCVDCGEIFDVKPMRWEAGYLIEVPCPKCGAAAGYREGRAKA
jgi:DNA-directed RNA polymerase subunit RPC12/RpoP